MTSVYALVNRDIRSLQKEYKNILKSRVADETELDFFGNYYLISNYILQVKKDIKHCKKQVNRLSKLYDEMCRAALSTEKFGEREIINLLSKSDVDYEELFLTELLVKCAVIHKIASSKNNSGAGIRDLQNIREIDFAGMFCICESEKIMEKFYDFAISDEETKMLYRKKAVEKAKKSHKKCPDYLKSVREKTKDNIIGKYLFTEKKYGYWTLTAEVLLSVILSVTAAFFCRSVFAGFIVLFPIWQTVSAIVVRISMRIYKTEELPRVKSDYLNSENSKTLIVVSILLTGEKTLKNMEKHIEKLYFSNCSDNVFLCISADLKSSGSEISENDGKILSAAKETVEEMNQKFGSNIICCVRPRKYSKTQNEFMGRERKRGAIEDLVFALKGGSNCFSHIFGANELPADVKYIMALDSDTDLTLDCTQELLQTALHPMNIDRYGIFTMRTEVDVECSDSTLFSALMAGDGGITAYHSTVAERYQDIFGRSIFSGKGLINIEKFRKKCCERFEEETVLSHDILEGELLGTAYVSRCQALDLFPTNSISYFKRLHRWVRGDWQNAVFLFDRAYSKLSKFKIFDNLRRSITPCFVWLCIIISAFAPSPISVIVFASAVLSVIAGDIISALKAFYWAGRGAFSRRFFSGNITHGIYPVIRGILSLIMLPAEASVCIDGALKGIYRRLVSKKNMLEWTTAQQGEKRSSKISVWTSLLPNILTAVVLFFSDYSFGLFMAVLFLMYIPFVLYSGKKRSSHKNRFDYLTRECLVDDCRKMWQYYADFANAENNFLPPDNVQFLPVYRVAQRTSPTNIGLMLASALSAYDLKIITEDEMYSFIENTLSSTEHLKTWRGNLYNWYDTVTLEPLEPYFVSAVDSGNFLCSLTSLKQGIEDLQSERGKEICKRIEKILQKTELSPFFNRKNGLLHIGYDAKNNKMSDSYYDLLMSEARMTSYYAVATRQVPRKHWENLSRRLSSYKGFSGPLSWTGTMFEFFMPDIFLPSYKNTLEYEGLKFCLLCQKNFGKENKIPFGVSESGYYDFDIAGNYRYKANGVPRLALKRDALYEPVISPYSTYLILPFERKSALKNLRELRKSGAFGKYGFYEAVDYTRTRTSGQEKMIVKSFMAHHIGMSILSADNALNNNIMQKRFMGDKRQMTAESLLRERIPNRPFTKNEKSGKQKSKNISVRYSPVKKTEADEKKPICAVYTNGDYTSVFCDSGASCSYYSGNTLFGIMKNASVGENGIFSAVFSDGKYHSFTKHGDFNNKNFYSAVIGERKVKYFSSSSAGDGEKEVLVNSDFNCETHSFSFKSNLSGDGYAGIYFQPILCPIESYLSHKSFAKLFVIAEKDEKNGCVVLKYTFRDNGETLFLCAGTDSEGAIYNLSREDVSQRGIYNVFADFENLSENYINVPDTCVAVKIPLNLKKGNKLKFRLVISVGKTREDAIASYHNGLCEERGAKSVYTISGQSRNKYFDMVTAAVLKTEISKEKSDAISNVTPERGNLWKYGISGDYPLFLCFADEKNLRESADTVYIADTLNKSGVRCELAVICKEKNQYDRSVQKQLFTNSPAIHFLDSNVISKDDENNLIAFACWCERWEKPETASEFFKDLKNALPAETDKNCLFKVMSDTALPWSWILSNRYFGTLLSNNSLGYTYYGNSQENKITPWINDVKGVSGERLFAVFNGEIYDIIDKSTMEIHSQYVIYYSKANGVTFKIKVSINNNEKVIEIDSQGGSDTEIIFCIFPVLDDRTHFPQFISAEKESGKIIFENKLKKDGLKYYIKGENATPFFFESEQNFHPSENPLLGLKANLKSNTSIKFSLGVQNGKNGETEKLGKITVNTPDDCLNRLYNDFLPVQIINGRILARTSFYQCSGAYGFRDQLQDIMSVIFLCPELSKSVIEKCLCAQFAEGDVLHWFHMGDNGSYRGVRTHYSDDLLWIILAVSKYCKVTGDYGFLKNEYPFLCGELLKNSEAEHYGEYFQSEEKASVTEHCLRAFEKAYNTGEHSLVLMGGGDWNDGFNKIGAKMKGESVFSSQLAVICGEKLCEILDISDDKIKSEEIAKKVNDLRNALETHTFKDGRYIRCFLDDGSMLGAEESTGCKIDSLTQSFAVFSGLSKERCASALNLAFERLADREKKVVRLFEPSFDKRNEKIGYITSYPAGIRENGGQYTHAAVWLGMALLENGQTDKGTEILKMLNPLVKYRDGAGERYKTEPYFLTGDVYFRKGLEGRGGWSLYTGSASWYYTAVTENVLGIRFCGDKLFFTPSVQEVLPFSVSIQTENAQITLYGEEDGNTLYCDGEKADYIPLDGKNHIGKFKNQ